MPRFILHVLCFRNELFKGLRYFAATLKKEEHAYPKRQREREREKAIEKKKGRIMETDENSE